MPLAYLALILSGIFWGAGFPLGKLALADLLPAHMILWRFAVASLLSLPFALASAEARALFRSPPVLLAGLFYGLAFLVQFEGLAGVTVSLAALLVGAMPALIAIAAWMMGERVSRTSWAGVIAATAGAALIAGKPDGAGTATGIALSLASLFVFLAWLFALKRAPVTRSAMAVPAVTVIVATAAILPVALLLHGLPPVALGATTWASVVGQGIFPTLLATAAWNYGATRVDSASAGVFINVEPLVGTLIGVTLFGDAMGWGMLLGGLLIVGGSVVTVLGERRTPGAADLQAAAHGLPNE